LNQIYLISETNKICIFWGTPGSSLGITSLEHTSSVPKLSEVPT